MDVGRRLSLLAFGAHVRVSAIVRPCYVRATTKPIRAFNELDVGVSSGEGPLRHEPADHWRMWDPDELGADGIPGEPLPCALPLPDRGGTYRVLRRFPIRSAEPQIGVVVGRTWRVEGQYHRAGPSGWDGEADQPYLVESRRVEVVEVALDPGDVVRAWPAQIGLAIPDDVDLWRYG